MEYNVLYKNKSEFRVEDRILIEEVLTDLSGVVYDAKSINLNVSKDRDAKNKITFICEIVVVKNAEKISSECVVCYSLAEALENSKNNILSKILDKNVASFSNAA